MWLIWAAQGGLPEQHACLCVLSELCLKDWVLDDGEEICCFLGLLLSLFVSLAICWLSKISLDFKFLHFSSVLLISYGISPLMTFLCDDFHSWNVLWLALHYILLLIYSVSTLKILMDFNRPGCINVLIPQGMSSWAGKLMICFPFNQLEVNVSCYSCG